MAMANDNMLSDDTLALVFSRLQSVKDRCALALTCRRWRALEALTRRTITFNCNSQDLESPDHTSILVNRLSRDLLKFPAIDKVSILRYTKLTDSFFAGVDVAFASRLKSLDLHYCSLITDHALSCIAKACPSLYRLTICRSTLITDEGLFCIGHRLNGLESFHISYSDLITDSGIDLILQKNHRLNDLCVSYCKQVQGWGLRNGHSLKKLAAEGCAVTDAGLIEGIHGSAELRVLDMGVLRTGTRLWSSGISAIGESCRKLIVLCLQGCQALDNSALHDIAQGCPNLKVMDMSLCHGVCELGWHSFATLALNLQYLDVNGCRRFGSTSLKAILNGCPSLTNLYTHICSSDKTELWRESGPPVKVGYRIVLPDVLTHINLDVCQ